MRPILGSSLPLVADVATDAELVSRCRSGDAGGVERARRAFLALRLRDLLQALPASSHDAEDVFQEVFARVYQHLERLRATTRSARGSRSSTRRLCIDRLRGARPRGAVELEDLEPGGMDETLARLDEALTVRAGLDAVGDAVPGDPRPVLLPDESYKAIGDALDLPAGTIASRISRCLGKLRSELEGRS